MTILLKCILLTIFVFVFITPIPSPFNRSENSNTLSPRSNWAQSAPKVKITTQFSYKKHNIPPEKVLIRETVAQILRFGVEALPQKKLVFGPLEFEITSNSQTLNFATIEVGSVRRSIMLQSVVMDIGMKVAVYSRVSNGKFYLDLYKLPSGLRKGTSISHLISFELDPTRTHFFKPSKKDKGPEKRVYRKTKNNFLNNQDVEGKKAIQKVVLELLSFPRLKPIALRRGQLVQKLKPFRTTVKSQDGIIAFGYIPLNHELLPLLAQKLIYIQNPDLKKDQVVEIHPKIDREGFWLDIKEVVQEGGIESIRSMPFRFKFNRERKMGFFSLIRIYEESAQERPPTFDGAIGERGFKRLGSSL